MLEYLPLFLDGLSTTVWLSVLGSMVTVVVAFVLGLMRLSRSPLLSWPATAVVEISRGTSLFVQVFWLFYALPLVGIRWDAFAIGVFAIGINAGAFASEVVRASIQAVPRAQVEAAVALNVPRHKRFFRIVLPQAVVLMIPGMSNVVVDLIKATSFVSLITVTELTFQMTLYRVLTGDTTRSLLALLAAYYVLCTLAQWGFDALDRRMTRNLDVTRRAP